MVVTYILYSKSINRYYVGHSVEMNERLREHNSGEGKYTKRGIPWRMVWTFECPTRSEAMLLEIKIKKRGVKRYLDDIKFRGVAQPG